MFLLQIKLLTHKDWALASYCFIMGFNKTYSGGITGFNQTVMHNNMAPEYKDGESFFSVLGVFFPTATGTRFVINY